MIKLQYLKKASKGYILHLLKLLGQETTWEGCYALYLDVFLKPRALIGGDLGT